MTEPMQRLPTGETLHIRAVRKLRRRAEAEAWAWRWVGHRPRDGWLEHAACLGTDTSVWFDEDKSKRNELIKFCHRCPVRLDCGAEAMKAEQREQGLVHGVRAGLRPADRFHAARIHDRLVLPPINRPQD